MKCKNLCSAKNAHLLVSLSVITLILAAAVSVLGLELWLAGTQWMLVSIVLAVYALIVSVHSCSDDESCSVGGCGCGCGSSEDEGDEDDKEQE